VALILAAESGLLAGLLLPGTATVVTAGFLTHPAYGDRPFAAVLATVIAASAAGANYGYARGLGGVLTTRLTGERYTRLLARVRTHPRTVTFAAHCIGGLRTLFPRMAADASIPYRRFAAANLAAACVWGSSLTIAGHASGTALERVRTASSLLGLPLLLAALACYLLWRAFCLLR
jgi:membrane protein DedA with SNARE-associated domain